MIGTYAFCCFAFVILSNIITADGDLAFTNAVCYSNDCNQAAVVSADNYRSLQNKANDDFKDNGYMDVWASEGGNTFTTDIQVFNGHAWPHISEGITTPYKTPGYKISLGDYLGKPSGRYIHYDGYWEPRTNGENPGNAPSGKRQNGAYIWLNENDNYNDNGDPTWPWNIEVNIWNRVVGIPGGRRKFDADYYDSNGRYEVWGGETVADGFAFYSYYFLLQENTTTNMLVNVKKVLEHIRDQTDGRVKDSHDLIEISVAAEGIDVADGKFRAEIYTMGRP